MFARCTTMQTEPGRVDEAVQLMQGRILDSARELPGFQGMLTFVDRASGKGLTFTLWESEQARQSTVDKADEIRAGAAEALQGTVLGVDNYELVIDAR